MEKLNVRFDDTVKERIKGIVEDIGFDDSKVARCAIDIGLVALEKLISEGKVRQAHGKVGIRMLRELLHK